MLIKGSHLVESNSSFFGGVIPNSVRSQRCILVSVLARSSLRPIENLHCIDAQLWTTVLLGLNSVNLTVFYPRQVIGGCEVYRKGARRKRHRLPVFLME